jgi:iron complex outermembrane receptor protein
LEKKNSGYYLHDRFYITDMLAVSAGYRHDRAKYTFSPSTPDRAVLDNDLGNIGATYTYGDKSSVYASYNKSFRYPLLDELFNFVSIDTSLVAQESDDYEFGIRHVFEDDLWVHAALFRIQTENEIFYNPIGGPFGFGGNENLDGKTQRDGVELAVKKGFGSLSITGSYTYTNAEIKDGQYAGNDVPGVPQHKASVGVGYSFVTGLMISVNGVYIGERPFESDFAGTLEKQEDYFLINAKLQYRYRKILAYLDFNNMTNEEYSEYGVLNTFTGEKGFYPSPERNILAGITVTY